jgi:hypothetical protein
MMIGPSFNRIQNYTLVSKGAIRTITRSITQEMCIAGGVGEVVFPFVPEHPGCFKESLVIVFLSNNFPSLSTSLFLSPAPELFHVSIQPCHSGKQPSRPSYDSCG